MMKSWRHIGHMACVAAAVAVAGCALPYLQLREQVSSLEGQPLSVAVARLGPPSVERIESGRTIKVWVRQETVDRDGDNQQCEILGVMRDDIVERIKYQGDENQCYRYAQALGGQ